MERLATWTSSDWIGRHDHYARNIGKAPDVDEEIQTGCKTTVQAVRSRHAGAVTDLRRQHGDDGIADFG